MDRENVKRLVSKGVKENIHGIVINEIWQCWDKVKKRYGLPANGMCTIELIVDQINKDLLYIEFMHVQQLFQIKTQTGTNNILTIVFLDEEEVMLLNEEAAQVFKALIK